MNFAEFQLVHVPMHEQAAVGGIPDLQVAGVRCGEHATVVTELECRADVVAANAGEVGNRVAELCSQLARCDIPDFDAANRRQELDTAAVANRVFVLIDD